MTEQTQETQERQERQERQEISAAPETPEAVPVVVPVGAPPMPAFPPMVPPLPARRDRRVLRAVLRWTAAAVVFAAVGSATTYGITRMERTDVPGLATASDGRWPYPELTRPPLPEGSPGPLADTNPAGAHYADLRGLLLPAPEGATENKALRGEDGWLETEDYLAEYEEGFRGDLERTLTDHGLRHIAARGWTTDDGTRTRIYLLHFATAAVVDDLSDDVAQVGSPGYALRDAVDSVWDEDFPEKATAPDVTRMMYTEAEPYGAEQVRHGYVSVGDVLALVVQSRKGTARAVPFQQTVSLQSRLLS